MSMRTHYSGSLRAEHIGQTVSLCGWVARRREHGEHLAFVDVRDHTGLVQCVVDNVVDVRAEYVVRVTGVVRHRPEGTVNANLPTGEVEVGEHVVLRHEAHLRIELHELVLPVGPEVLVAKTAGDLVVAIDARHHQQLLEQLR